ncbi:hypothetical protein HK097_001829, partial [Rhizophlyctis rosea]
ILLNTRYVLKRNETVKKLLISPDHSLLAYLVVHSAKEQGTLCIRDLSGRWETVRIQNVFNMTWGENGAIYFTRLDATLRASKVFRFDRSAGDSADKEELIYEALEDSAFLDVGRTKDGTDFYILNNSNNPTSLRLSCLPDSTPLPATWADTTEIFGAAEDEKIEEVELFEDYAAVFLKEAGVGEVKVYQFASGNWGRVRGWVGVGCLSVGENRDYKSDVLRFEKSDPFTMSTQYEWDMRRKELRTVWEQRPVGFPQDDFVTECNEVAGWDGVRIPVTLIRAKTVKLDGSPVLLHAYGAYGVAVEASFRLEFLPLLRRRFVIALAHVRGGSELGRNWYEDGKAMKKENSFRDFEAVAEWMIGEGYCTKERMGAVGFSAGGMLLATVLNRRPDLFRAIILRAPFLDPLTAMLNPSSSLSIVERSEWGDPISSPSAYDYISNYAPYDTIPHNAPFNTSILITMSADDQRVSVLAVLKWVARMRERNREIYGMDGGRKLLCKIGEGYGHWEGDPGRRLEGMALECAFLCRELGLGEFGEHEQSYQHSVPGGALSKHTENMIGDKHNVARRRE